MVYQHYPNELYRVEDDEEGKETLEEVRIGKQRPDDNEEDVPGANQRVQICILHIGNG